jgi:capsular polysaccharide transport system permease protein
MVGLLAYFMFQRTGKQAATAIRSNAALFAYRQVKPVDTVLASAFLEGTMMLVVSSVLLCGAGLLGLAAMPRDPLLVLVAWGGMWICGVGFALTTSVVGVLSSELGRVLGMLTRPLYLISGVVFPVHAVPPPYRDWLLYNPLLHGLEATRSGFAPYYHAVPGVEVSYLYFFGLCLLLLGLLMHVGFARRMVTQ